MIGTEDLIEAFSSPRVLLVGDLLLDRYTYGNASRVSPEAPILILNVSSEEVRAGGVGNVAFNLSALGARVSLLGRIGDDESGAVLMRLLGESGCDLSAVCVEAGFQTPCKNRLVSRGQQLIRIDHEQIQPLHSAAEQVMIALLPQQLQRCDIVAVSDYGKGTVTPQLLRELIALAKQYDLPVIVDPKGVDFRRYSGATIVKPNLAETYAAARCDLDTPLEVAAQLVRGQVDVDILMVTRAEEGISLFYRDGVHQHYPVEHAAEVKDITGAGDTVLAVMAVAMGSGLDAGQAASLSNVAASIAIERVGCVSVTKDMLRSRLHARSV